MPTTMSAPIKCPADTPQVVSTGYSPKGSWIEVAGLKTYITGPNTAKHAIITIYDIWGPAPQTLQGADMLSHSLSAMIFIPDFLIGKYAETSFIQGKTPEDQAAKAAFWATLAFEHHEQQIKDVVRNGGEKYPSVESWGLFGLCWGGKMSALSSAKGTPFKVSGQAHPGSPTKGDAESMVIPHIALAAPEDNKSGGIDGYKEVFGKPGSQSVVETYDTMFHGWMGARAKLDDEENVKEFRRGYTQIADFFIKNL